MGNIRHQTNIFGRLKLMSMIGTMGTHIGHMSREPYRPLVFLSNSKRDEDHPVFSRLLSDLRADRRIRLWYAPNEIKTGDSLFERMGSAIADSDFCLYVVPEPETLGGSMMHEFLLGYTNHLRRQKATMIPVLIGDRPVSRMLRGALECIDLAIDYDGGFAQIVELILTRMDTPLATFGLDTIVETEPIIEVTTLIGERLIAYFAKHPEEMRRMERRKFEELVAEIFSGFGYTVELTQQTRDGGHDVIAIAKREIAVKYLIECKRPDPGGHVGIRPVRELYGVKCDEKATKAILATTAHFSPDALLFFENHRWELEPRDYDGLLDWLKAYEQLKKS